MGLHTCTTSLPEKDLPTYHGSGLDNIEKPRYEAGRLYVNDRKYFEIEDAVWEFKVGNYRVLEQYFKARTGYKSKLKGVDKVRQIMGSIRATLEIMDQLDTYIDPVLGDLRGNTIPYSSLATL